MQSMFARVTDLVSSVKGDLWGWFMTLTREEWMVVLAVACACGFVALLGYRSRCL